MLKKMTLLAMAIGALVAFAIPAVAQATELVETTEGTPHALPIGAEITATSGDLETTTAGPTLECSLVTLHLEVLSNGPGPVRLAEVEPESTTTSGCNALITEPTVGEITLSEGEGSAEAHFVADLAPTVSCTLGGLVEFTYEEGTDLLNILGSTLTGPGPTPPCPSDGVMHGNFTLETNTVPPTPVEILG